MATCYPAPGVGHLDRASGRRWDRLLLRRAIEFYEAHALLLAVLFAQKQSYTATLMDSHTRLQLAHQHQRALLTELDHRVKNALATVSAVASLTKDTSGSMEEFVTALDGRIRSMAHTHELLSVRGWRGVPLAELVECELAAYASRDNVEINGPELMLRPEAGQPISMVIHELATNAAKYGALSMPCGRVSVLWDRVSNGSPRFVLLWRETGGPRVGAPQKAGGGTRIIRDLIPYEIGGTVDISFAPEGFQCRLEVPLKNIIAETPNASGTVRTHEPSENRL